MAHYNVDVTPLVTPTITWANVAPFMPKREPSLVARTAFTTTTPGLVDFFAVEKGPLAPTAAAGAQDAPTAEPTPTFSEAPAAISAVLGADVERISKQRLQLMAAKYASDAASVEIVARLEILNHRLLDRAPRVSKDQVLALENAYNQVARIQAAREDRSRRLGLPIQR